MCDVSSDDQIGKLFDELKGKYKVCTVSFTRVAITHSPEVSAGANATL